MFILSSDGWDLFISFIKSISPLKSWYSSYNLLFQSKLSSSLIEASLWNILLELNLFQKFLIVFTILMLDSELRWGTCTELSPCLVIKFSKLGVSLFSSWLSVSVKLGSSRFLCWVFWIPQSELIFEFVPPSYWYNRIRLTDLTQRRNFAIWTWLSESLIIVNISFVLWSSSKIWLF